MVDNFGVQVNSDQEASHIINALQEKYTIDVDYTGSLYVGVTLKWNYKLRYMDYSMPNYIPNLLEKINYEPKKKPRNAPHPCLQIKYGQKTQIVIVDNSKPVGPKETKFIKSVNGSLLFYRSMLDNLILVATSSIGTE